MAPIFEQRTVKVVDATLHRARLEGDDVAEVNFRRQTVRCRASHRLDGERTMKFRTRAHYVQMLENNKFASMGYTLAAYIW
jgi:hypothetical protein